MDGFRPRSAVPIIAAGSTVGPLAPPAGGRADRRPAHRAVIRRWLQGLVAVLVLVGLQAPVASAGPSRPFRFLFARDADASERGHPVPTQGRSALPIHPDAYTRAKASANARANGQPFQDSVATESTGGTSVSATAGDATVGPSWDGQFQTDLTPPDPTGAVGPNSYIQLTNLRFGIYDRSGGLVSQGTMEELSGLFGHSLSDPQVLWDPDTGLFYYLILDISNNTFGIGWSRNANPQSAADFCKYFADYGYGFDIPDYPKLGTTDDFLLVGSNVFGFFGFLGYLGSDVAWLDKPPAGPLLSCPDPSGFNLGKFTAIKNPDNSFATTPVPAVQTDTSGSGWVVAVPDPTVGGANSLTVFRVTKAGANASLSPGQSIPVPHFSVPANAPQQGTSALLDTLDARLTHAVSGVDPAYGANAVWTSHAVFGGAGAEVRWYEIDPMAGSILQSGVASDPSLYVWNGAVSPDRAVGPAGSAFGSNMVLGFNTSSSGTHSAVQFVYKMGSEPQSGFVTVKQSPGPNDDFSCSPCRWGDYSAARPDPLDVSGTAGTVWLSNEWNVASVDPDGVDWRTRNWAVALEAALNNPPTAEANGPYGGAEDAAVTFSSAGSSDPDGDPLIYTWDFGDGTPPVSTTGTTVSHTYLWGGTFTATLTVSDGRGGTASDTATATVSEVNDVPVSDPNGPYQGVAGTAIMFNGSGSSDFDNQDGTVANDQALTYKWDFGDESTADTTTPTLAHTYAAAGTYTVTLVVNDGLADSGPRQTTTQVSGQSDPNGMYVWNIAFDSRLRGRGGQVHDERIMVTVRRDSDGDGVAESTDAVVPGASVTIVLTGPSGGTFSGTTDSSGNFRTGWISNLPDGAYVAEVIGLTHATYVWQGSLDPTASDADGDGDGLPDQAHAIPH